MGHPGQSGRNKEVAKERLAQQRAESTDVMALCKNAVFVRLADMDGFQLFFPPTEVDATSINTVVDILARLGITDNQARQELRFGGRSMFGVTVKEDHPKTTDILWQYGDDGELGHPRINELQSISRDAAARELFQVFYQRGNEPAR